MTKIRLEDISYVYSAGTPYEKHALDNINLDIRAGVITGVIGHTGSGKSTLMQLLNGLERPTAGKVYLDGVDIWEQPKKISAVRFRVGLVMQYPEYQLFEETVEKDIAFGPRNMGLSDDEIARRVAEAAGFVGLAPELMKKSPFDLSGGEKRRAAIAGVMAMTPEVLVLDEPAAGLDPVGRSTIFDAVERYRAGTGATVIIVSHSMEDMARICDDVVVLSGGRIIMTGSTSEVFCRADELSENGLDIPEVSKLMLRLREMDVPVSEIPYSVSGAYEILKKDFAL
ncbi:MAG: energy-coupling factor transporter ATPase [Eubacteriales bacterium]|nr:energy-coupling factor transporter ATPase [Eubacteriales bacterium]MDY4897423.1 energy-coupling factor transporter ATPase [Eubacteriales bacterium]